MSRFRPPRDCPDIGEGPSGQQRFKAWLRTAFVEIAEDLAAVSATDAPTVVHQERLDVPAGAQRRVSPPTGGMAVVLPAPTSANSGMITRIMIESPVGALTVVASPGVGADGKVFASTINGQSQATFSLAGVVSFHSNGVNDWKTFAETPIETPPVGNTLILSESLDATYHLQTAHASLPNARVGTDSTEIDVDYSVASVVSWALRTASVVFAKLQDLTGLSVLGRATNSSGVMAAITATTARTVLRVNDAGTALQWGDPVQIADDNVVQGDAFELSFNSGTHTTAVATAVAGFADVTFNVNLATLVPAIDSPSVVADGTVIERAALSGAISAAQDSNATLFAGIRDNGSAETDRTNLNFVSSTSNTLVVTDDAGSDELEVTVQRAALTGAITAAANSNTTVMNTGWDGVLAVNRASGAFNPNIIAGQYLQFGPDASLPTSGDVRKTATLQLNTGGSLDAFSAAGAQITSSAGNVIVTAGSVTPATLRLVSTGADVVVDASTTATIGAGSGNVVLNATAAGQEVTVNANDGLAIRTGTGRAFLLFEEEASSLLGNVAGEGSFWVRSDVPNVPMFTDDTNEDWRLAYHPDRRIYSFYEEFDHCFAEDAAAAGEEFRFGTTTWTAFSVVTGDLSDISAVAGEDNHPGIIAMITEGDAIGDSLALVKSASGATEHILAQDIRFAEFIIRLPSVTNIFISVGFENNIFAGTTDSIRVYLSSAADSSFHTLTEEGGAGTDTDTGLVAVLNTWYVVTIRQDTIGTIDFYINDALELSTSSNIPDAEGLTMTMGVQNTVAAAKKTLQVDYVAFESQNLGVRF